MELISSLAAQRSGEFQVELTDNAFVIHRDGAPWCRGQVTVGDRRPDRLLLGIDSGPGCPSNFHYAEIGWELDGQHVLLPHEEFRGDVFDAVLWTAKPLERVGSRGS